VRSLGQALLIPEPVLVEADLVLRRRGGAPAARELLEAALAGTFTVVRTTPGLLARAVELDARYADLDLGLVDASVMAYAERHDLPILTFDFAHFRATAPTRGYWRLVVDEKGFEEIVGA
jgi:predicted nucleic acid-binding protein